MARQLDPADLPEHVARYAQAQVDAGRFASIEDVLSAGVEALQERDRSEQEWLAYARKEAEDGFAALDHNEGIRGTAAEHVARIDATVYGRGRENGRIDPETGAAVVGRVCERSKT
jgi:Arc/MetJ-type ribon-helix-helix transcriptional regulator